MSAPLGVVEHANSVSRDAIVDLLPVSDLDIQEGRKATHFVCVCYCSLQPAIRYCGKGCDVSKWVSIVRCNFMGTYVKSKRRNLNISLTGGVSI